LNNQFEHSGTQRYTIDSVITSIAHGKGKDADMMDCSPVQKKMSCGTSDMTCVSTNNMDLSSGDGSGERASEIGSNYSKVMYDRWQKVNMTIPQLDQ
jgi:hypothetical protein